MRRAHVDAMPPRAVDILAPALELHARRGWSTAAFQRTTWSAFLAGESSLVHAPTGTGKTEAAALGVMLEALARPSSERGLRLLWITPLRALARDLVRALEATARDLGLAWRVEDRTSDTTPRVRARQRKALPEVLVTTPESVSVMLARPDGEPQLASVRCIVVDEWQELIGGKRGVQVELALARVRTLVPAVRVIGLSASLGDPEHALDVLVPRHAAIDAAPRRLVRADVARDVRIETLLPRDVTRHPWAGHLGLAALPDVARRLDEIETALVFTNTRFQAEAWFAQLLARRPEWAGVLALHHGSLDRELRGQVERLLVARKLKVVVCTSSLDLGVDFPAVELVVQIGSPKGAARLLQRAGRSGHRPGAASRVLCVPTHALELAEFAAARTLLANGRLEARSNLDAPLDVLVQHLLTLGAGAGFDEAELLREVRTTHAYRALTDMQWSWALDFARRGGPALHAYPNFARLEQRAGRWHATSTRLAALHRLNIGTITSDGAVQVRFARGGGRLGDVEETFAARLKPGQSFRFAGRELAVVALRDQELYVKRATSTASSVGAPRWMGGSMALSSDIAGELRRQLGEALDDERALEHGSASTPREPELEVLAPLLRLQAARSHVPLVDEVLIECVQVRRAHFAFVYAFEGRAAHEGLALLVAWRLARASPRSIGTAATEYGFALEADAPLPRTETEWRALLSPVDVRVDLEACVRGTDLARRRFRTIARVAGLVQRGWPGARKSRRDVAASGGLFHDVFSAHDPDNLLLEQARDEVLVQQIGLARVEHALQRCAASRFVVHEPVRLTPFAFPLWAESLRNSVSSESWEERVRAMAASLEHAVDART